MEAAEVLDLLDALDVAGVTCWLDGGWGVDCLLEEQTRLHGDLDLVVFRDQLEHAVQLPTERGYGVIRDWLPTSLAWRDPAGPEVDLHPVDRTPDDGGDQVLPDGTTFHYGPPVVGRIDGRPVRCASVEDQIRMHQGYEPRPVDRADVRRLAGRYGLPLPDAFA